ncbi:MAG: hypothetical protein ACI8RZ_004975 [Myxococcota bacterium]|jgi:hypothetical protein
MRNLTILLTAGTLLIACGDKEDDSGTTTDDTAASSDMSFCTDLVEGFCYLGGEYTGDITLTTDYDYVLEGGVFIGDDTSTNTLTIEAGVTIYGDSATDGFLTIRRNAKIMAVGTADAPIVFTSAQAVGSRGQGDWGGLILNGNAPINNCSDGVSENLPCEAEGEGGTGFYGGEDAADSSGTLKYVRLEYGGTEITTDNEVNGIAFQGVGSGTTVSYVQVHMNKDDGVEFFGGTVNVDHLVLTAIGDDSFDYVNGWSGTADTIAIRQYDAIESDRGFELDNFEDQEGALPRSNPNIKNVTLIGGGGETQGMTIRRGSAGSFDNIAATGFGDTCIDIDSTSTWELADSGALTMTNSVLACSDNFKEDDDAKDGWSVESWFTGQSGNSTTSDLGLTDWLPTSGTLGAFSAGDDWTVGWTNYALN